jgi:hypothetical protein
MIKPELPLKAAGACSRSCGMTVRAVWERRNSDDQRVHGRSSSELAL